VRALVRDFLRHARVRSEASAILVIERIPTSSLSANRIDAKVMQTKNLAMQNLFYRC
jgi:hypothetical protein